MALTIGNTVASTTTLATLLDTAFATKSGGTFTGSTATYTASDGQTLVATWPAQNQGNNAVYISLLQRPVAPAAIAL